MEFMPAPFWRRLVARLIDLLVCVPLTFVATIPILVVIVPLSAVLSDDATGSLGAFLCFFLAYGLVEYFLLRRRSGQTLGKGLLGLRVLNVSDIPTDVKAAETYAGGYSPIHTATGADVAGAGYGHPGAPVGVEAVSAVRSTLSARSALMRMLVLIGPLIAYFAAFYITYDADTGTSEGPIPDAFLGLWVAVLAACAISALVDRRARRGLHDFAGGTRVVRAQRRGIDLREDLKMLVPGRVSLEKRTPPPVTLTKTIS